MLGLVETPGGDALVTPLGKQVLETSMSEKKALIKQQLLKLNVFRHVVKLLENSDEREVPAQVILEELAMLLPQEQPREMFTTILNWGRYGEVFGYSRDPDLLYLQKTGDPA
jgi:NitT/TauT family transport system ATP-binding protein